MRKTYTVENGTQLENQIHLQLNGEMPNCKWKAAGQVITDSDEMAFVYLMDAGEGYQYIKFPQTIWPLLVKTLQSDSEPLLTWGEEQIELVNFQDELNALIFNIEGNHNYGVDFSTAVEEAFAEILNEA
ncbi:hypothetical protein JFL43_08530 [Viridibacillus sp. YIM B01967]|uniref:Uncharacterized protein n=1 Tax=Viridibacillus soli TaxID=2798301 RepID=A0ABS1H682_9BACL|nr:hypothetical protein [Viridibacillus soli]MBK3494906.1 hypothetical protein [Viridibacillus soli]